MPAGWPKSLNSTLRSFLLFIYVFFVCVQAYSPVANSTSVVEIKFGDEATSLIANQPVSIRACFKTRQDTSSRPKENPPWPLQLVAVASDLQAVLRFPVHYTAPQGDTWTAQFENVTFPTGGQYLLLFDGQLPDGTGQAQQSVANAYTTIGVGGLPTHDLFKERGNPRVGLADIVVHSIPHAAKQQVISLSELVNGSAAAAPQNSSSTNATDVQPDPAAGRDQYRVTLDAPSHCTPGHPSTYKWAVTNATSGEPVTDLQWHDGAPVHLLVVSSDLAFVLHTSGGMHPFDGGKRISSSSSSSSSGGSSVVQEAAAAVWTNHSATAAAGGASSSNATTYGTQDQQQQQEHADAGQGRRLMRLLLQAGTAQGRQRVTQPQSGAASNSTLFGPSMYAQVTLPSYGTYLFVAEVARGDDLIGMPFLVSCNSSSPALESAGVTHSSSAGPLHGAAALLHPLALAAFALLMQHMLL